MMVQVTIDDALAFLQLGQTERVWAHVEDDEIRVVLTDCVLVTPFDNTEGIYEPGEVAVTPGDYSDNVSLADWLDRTHPDRDEEVDLAIEEAMRELHGFAYGAAMAAMTELSRRFTR